jgi:anti-sigma-K factor RskA
MACDERVESLLLDYHLGQLSDAEAEEVRLALEESAECRERLEEVSRLLDLVPLSAPRADPPAELRARVLARATAVEDRVPRPTTDREDQPPVARSVGRFRRFAPLLAAAVLLIVVVTPLTASYLELREENRRLEAEIRVLDAGDREELRVAAVEGTDRASDARGTVVLDPSTGELAFAAYDLPSPPNGHAYHAWLIGTAGAQDLGEMEPDAGGDVSMTGQTPDPQASYETLEVTVEPEGGAPEKTGPIYLQGKL